MRLNLVLVICVAQAGGLSGGKLTSLDNLDQITFLHIYLLQAFTLAHIEFRKWPHGATITAMHLIYRISGQLIPMVRIFLY